MSFEPKSTCLNLLFSGIGSPHSKVVAARPICYLLAPWAKTLRLTGSFGECHELSNNNDNKESYAWHSEQIF